MIYIIDEDYNQMQAWLFELLLSNLEYKYLPDADAALRNITILDSKDILVVDVMLAVDANEARSSFSRDLTDDYKTTGLAFLKKMFDQYPEFPKSRVLLVSQASVPRTIERIKAFSTQYGVWFKPKGDYGSVREFAEDIVNMMNDEGEGEAR